MEALLVAVKFLNLSGDASSDMRNRSKPMRPLRNIRGVAEGLRKHLGDLEAFLRL